MSSSPSFFVRAAAAARTPALEPLENRTLLSNGSLPGVPDVLAQFTALKHHGEGVGWFLPEAQGAPDPSSNDHYQGIVRYPGAGTPVMYVTQLDNDDTDDQGGTTGGYLEVIRLGSRKPDGERLGSNLQRPDAITALSPPEDGDTWLKSFRFNGIGVTIDGHTLRPYKHVDGMCIIDNILFVGMDQADGSGFGGTGMIVLFDLGANGEHRESPVPIQALSLNHDIDNLSVTPDADGKYLIWTNGDGGGDLHFYRTNGGDLRADSLALDHVQEWNPNSAADFDPNVGTIPPPFTQGDFWPSGSGAHQGSAFIREFDGANPTPDSPLYLIGMRHPGGSPFSGDDFADLYRVTNNGAGGFKLTRVMTLHEFLVYDGAGRIGNFAGGDNAYVSPSGELILYSVQHDDEDSADPDYVKIAEIRHRDVNRPGSPLRQPQANAGGGYVVNEGGSVALNGSATPAADRPWIELFDDNRGWLHGFEHPSGHEGDRSIVIDYDDRAKFELDNFNLFDNFGDKASSIRWRMPIGLDAELFVDDHQDGHKIVIEGTGQTESIDDLEDLDFGDVISSMRFVGDAPPSAALAMAWDLDADGVFGETGAAAANGDEVGATPTFNASSLDGPGSRAIALRVTDAGTGASTTTTSNVTIMNVAPTADVAGDTFGVTGQPRNFNLSATDPSAADALAGFTFAVNFGDGNAIVISPGDPLVLPHRYLSAGVYTLSVTATDKDGGVSTAATHVIEIKSAGILPDPTDPTKTALYVGGTTGNDIIKVIQLGKTGSYDVTVNGVSKGTFGPTGRIIIFGQAGNDSIDVPNSVTLPVEMYGGDGNDSMSGGSGADLISGDAGNDVLTGGQGRDVLIGGAGLDQLNGNADDDVLIGSATIHDADFVALHAIQLEWLRSDATASIRSAHLLNGTGLNGAAAKLDAASILDDGVLDLLHGASGDDFERQ